MSTANDIIEAAYGHIGVIGQGKTMNAYLAQKGLKALNNMLSMWSTEPFLVISRTSDDYTVVTAATQFTIGSGGTINTVRPEQIVDGYIRIGGSDYPLDIFTMGEYNDIGYKSAGAYPSCLWYEPSYPLGVISFDSKVAAGHIIHIDSYKPFTAFAGLTTTVAFPAGYEEAMEFNLALRLAPANGKTPNQFVVGFAQQEKDKQKLNQ